MNNTFVKELIAVRSDIELVNLIQGMISLLATLIVLIRVSGWDSCLKSVRERKARYREKKQKQRFEEMRLLMESMQQTTEKPVGFSSVRPADSSDSSNDLESHGHRIARKKTSSQETKDGSTIALR